MRDWALFVDRQWKEIDWPFVTDWLSRLGLLKFFICMNALSINCLGIAAEKFPVLEMDAELEKRVLEDVLHPTFDEKGSGFLFKTPKAPGQYVETQSGRLRSLPAKNGETCLEPSDFT